MSYAHSGMGGRRRAEGAQEGAGGRTAVSQACGNGPVCLSRGTPRVRPPSPCLQGEKGHPRPLVLWALDSRHCLAWESCIVSFYGFFPRTLVSGLERGGPASHQKGLHDSLPPQPASAWGCTPFSSFPKPSAPRGVPPAHKIKSKQQAREMLN